MTIDSLITETVRQVVREEMRAAVAELRAALPPAQLVTVDEAAAIAGVSVATMRRRVKAGEIRVKRIGRSVRIDPAALRPPSEAVVLELAHAIRFPR